MPPTSSRCPATAHPRAPARLLALLTAVLFAAAAAAAPQELGLDLSDPEVPATPPPPKPPLESPPRAAPASPAVPSAPAGDASDASLGLDLSSDGAGVAPAYRPVVAVLPVVTAAGTADAVTLGRARILEAELVRLARADEGFQSVMAPSELDAKLGAEAASARACLEWPCFEKAAAAAGVHRLLSGTVERLNTGANVTLRAYDPSLQELVVIKEEYAERAQRSFAGMGGKSQQQKERDFARAMAEPIAAVLSRIRTPNGRLVVECAEPAVEVWVDGRLVGSGATEVYVARGAHTVRTRSEEFLPFEQVVTVAAGADAKVTVVLVAKPLDSSARPATPAPGVAIGAVASRPGFIVAAAGVAAVVTGLVLGQLALAVEGRAAPPDANGIVAITRAEAKLARTEALLANVLVAAGGAAVVGGGAWLAVSFRSSGGGSAPALGAPAEPGELRGQIILGGSF